MKEIHLPCGKTVKVDDEDYESLSQYNWHANKGHGTYYAIRGIGKSGRTNEKIYMHREIMKASEKQQVDHISGNGLDCQKSNMRLCTPGQNNMNRRKNTRRCSSQYIGVSLDKRRGTWHAYINIERKRTNLGCFASEFVAAKVRDIAAIKLFKNFAHLNFTKHKQLSLF